MPSNQHITSLLEPTFSLELEIMGTNETGYRVHVEPLTIQESHGPMLTDDTNLEHFKEWCFTDKEWCCKGSICHSLRNGCGSELSTPPSAASSQPHPSSLCHENQPWHRLPTSHTVCMPCPHKPARWMVGEKWPLRDWVRTGYLISHAPCHVRSCTYITKVNRTSIKGAEMLPGKGSLVVPPFSSSLKEVVLSD